MSFDVDGSDIISIRGNEISLTVSYTSKYINWKILVAVYLYEYCTSVGAISLSLIMCGGHYHFI